MRPFNSSLNSRSAARFGPQLLFLGAFGPPDGPSRAARARHAACTASHERKRRRPRSLITSAPRSTNTRAACITPHETARRAPPRTRGCGGGACCGGAGMRHRFFASGASPPCGAGPRGHGAGAPQQRWSLEVLGAVELQVRPLAHPTRLHCGSGHVHRHCRLGGSTGGRANRGVRRKVVGCSRRRVRHGVAVIGEGLAA